MLIARYLYVIFLLVVSEVALAQTQIRGVINFYGAVTNIDYCQNRMTVDDATGFAANQKVIIIQMKGAQINTSNTSSFGDVTDYKNAGNYEINTIQSVSSNVIRFRYAITRDYDATGAVQIVSLPEYADAHADSVLKVKPWDGASGGVFAIKAGTLTLSDSIDLRGKGFRGAALDNGTDCWNSIGGYTAYSGVSNLAAARKGEGIATPPTLWGRGKAGNGGGGGNDHNTGGGGGSNFGGGGLGGNRVSFSPGNCTGDSPGNGGAALTYSNSDNKIFMGGGGGAGDENNNEGTAGANGGGICIIIANSLISNDVKINANGDKVPGKALSDGAGAGGAGGTVLLSVGSFLGNLEIDVNGGNGGVLDNGGPSFCFGPGGGGGAGMLWIKNSTLPNFVNLVDTGGMNGRNVFGLAPPTCPTGSTNGAQPGQPGGMLTGLVIPEDTTLFVPLSATACCDTTVCPGEEVPMAATGTATYPPTYQWNNGATTNSTVETVFFNSSFDVTVTDHRGCQLIRTVRVTIPTASACCDVVVCPGTEISMTTANNFSNPVYSWSTGATTSSITETVSATTVYTVTIGDGNGCEIVKTLTATVAELSVTIHSDSNYVLPGHSIQLTASTDSAFTYQWSPSTSLSSDSIYDPVATPTANMRYCVTVTDPNGCTASACKDISISGGEVKVPDAFSPNGDDLNDVFTIFPLYGAEILQIRIFNRWGELVYDVKGNNAWDGTHKGKPQQAGAFVCYVSWRSLTEPEKTNTIVKNVVLIR